MYNYLSKLRLCDAEAFSKITKPFQKTKVASGQWFVENIKQGPVVLTDGVYDCVSPCFANPKINGTIQHICPNDENLSKLVLGNKLLAKKLEAGQQRLNAILVGGINYPRSQKVIDSLVGFCEEHNIPYSKLLKHQNIIDNTGSDIAYLANENEYLLSSKEISDFLEKNKKRFLHMPKEEVRAELEKFLKNHYEETEVSKLNVTV